MRTASAALIQSWWLDGAGAEQLLERTVEQIHWTQRQNAKARVSHTKRTKQKLRDAGIRLADLPRCHWRN